MHIYIQLFQKSEGFIFVAEKTYIRKYTDKYNKKMPQTIFEYNTKLATLKWLINILNSLIFLRNNKKSKK